MTRAWLALAAAVALAGACTDKHAPSTPDAASTGSAIDAPTSPGADAIGTTADADPNACSANGAPGDCMLTTACSAMTDRTPVAGYCAGAADIECCIVTPNVADNPPTPAGYELMPQADVTAAMTTWAVDILHDPTTYPLFSTATMVFGTLTVLARVEWHPPDGNNETIHRGVTLYEPL